MMSIALRLITHGALYLLNLHAILFLHSLNRLLLTLNQQIDLGLKFSGLRAQFFRAALCCQLLRGLPVRGVNRIAHQRDLNLRFVELSGRGCRR